MAPGSGAVLDEDLTRGFQVPDCRVCRLADGRAVVDVYVSGGQLWESAEELLDFLDRCRAPVNGPVVEDWERTFREGFDAHLARLSEAELMLGGVLDDEARWAFWIRVQRRLRAANRRGDAASVARGDALGGGDPA